MQFRRRFTVHVAAFVGYVAVSLAATWPLITRFFTHIPGENGDARVVFWHYWYLPHALAAPGVSLVHAKHLLAPYGADLVFHGNNLLMVLATLPVRWLGGIIAAGNAGVLMPIVLGGFFFFQFCRMMGCGATAAWLGGLAFAFSPFVFAHLPGHFPLIQIHWVSLFAWLWTLTLQPCWGGLQSDGKPDASRWKPRWLLAMGLGIAVWGMFVTDIYFALMGTVLGAAIAVFQLAKNWRLAVSGPVWTTTVLAAGISVLLATPWAWAFRTATAAHNYANLFPWAGSEAAVDWRNLLKPPPFHPLLGSQFHPPTALHPGSYSEKGYLGIAALWLSTLAIALPGHRRAALFWWFCLVLFVNLAMANRFTDIGNKPAWLFIGKQWPEGFPFDQFRIPARFVFAAGFCVALLAALGLDGLLRVSPGRKRKWAIIGAAMGIVAFDFAAAPIPLIDARPNSWFFKHRLHGNGTLLTFPVGVAGGASGTLGQVDSRQFVDQMAHQKPLLSAYLARVPADVTDKVASDPVMKALFAASTGNSLTTITKEQGADFVKRANVKWILLPTGYNTQVLQEFVKQKFPVDDARLLDGFTVYTVSIPDGSIAP